MEREKIEKLIAELKENFVKLDLRCSRDVMKEPADDLSMHILLPEDWQKAMWAIDVSHHYGLENTVSNAVLLSECGFRSLAKHILSEKKYKKKSSEAASIHWVTPDFVRF